MLNFFSSNITLQFIERKFIFCFFGKFIHAKKKSFIHANLRFKIKKMPRYSSLIFLKWAGAFTKKLLSPPDGKDG